MYGCDKSRPYTGTRDFVALLIYYTTGVDACAPMSPISGVAISQKLKLMTKAKKQTNKQMLTREEFMSRAPVPEYEQHYKIPANWVWTRLHEVVSPSFEKFNNFSKEGDTTYIGLEHIEKDAGITGCGSASSVKSLKNVFVKGDILYGKLRPYLNKHDIADFDGICSTDILVFKPRPIAFIKLVNYYLDTDKFIEYAISNSRGINLPRVAQAIILQMPFPLPPLAEQQRIVERIESLFEKLDRAKELAQSAIDSFEVRKAAIMHKAFTGELLGLKHIKTVSLLKISDDIRIGPFGTILHAEDYVLDGIPVINPKHIREQKIYPQANVSISEEKARELASYVLRENDIILGRRGEMGRAAPVSVKESGWLCGTGSMLIRLKPGFIASFYSQIISSQKALEYLEQNAVGSTMKNLNERIVSSIPVPLFSLPEQHEIVRILDSMLDKERRARELYDVIEKIGLMKKAILARAFRGKLGTNDPADMEAPDMGAQASLGARASSPAYK